LLVVRNNLALTPAEQGEYDAAMEEIGVALSANSDPVLEKQLRNTEATIRRRMASGER